MIAEVERLNKIIAKELSENDELGAEYTYVNALRGEVERLRDIIDLYEADPVVKYATRAFADLSVDKKNKIMNLMRSLWEMTEEACQK